MKFKINKSVIFLLFMCCSTLLFCWTDPDRDLERRTLMVDPTIDEKEPFCYLAKSTTTLSLPGTDGTQVTFDGSLYTGAAELAFFYGKPLQPLLARNRELTDGWIPIVQYQFSEKGIEYHIEAFSYPLDGDIDQAMINFIQVRMTNNTEETTRGYFSPAIRFTGIDHRFEHMRPYDYNPEWEYTMDNGYLAREEESLFFYPPTATLKVVPGITYEEPYRGSDFHLIDSSPHGFAFFNPELEPGESNVLHFFFPRKPVPLEEKELLKKIQKLDYSQYRKETLNYWKNLYQQGAELHIPEAKVQEAHKASLMYTWQGIWRNEDKDWIQGVNKLQYRGFWLRDGAYILRNHDIWGHNDLVRKLLQIYPDYQNEEGLFLSWEGQLDGFGQALYTLAQHALITRDREYAAEIYPHFIKAMEWLYNTREEDEMNLMPPSSAGDNELIEGRYTGHNLWALLGVRSAIRLALFLEKEEDAQYFKEQYEEFKTVFKEKLRLNTGKEGVIPPGIDTEGGQDWGNLIGLFPTEVLHPDDPRIYSTLQYLRREKYQEGCMTYLGNIHHYLTVKATQNFLMTQQPQEVLRDFYSILVHMGSCHEMFEWEAQPWGDRDTAGNLPPHGWGAAMFNLLLRNMLVQERGGDGGINCRNLHIFSVISPEWAQEGKNISLQNAVTDLGRISQKLTFTSEGATLSFESDFHTNPAEIVFTVPCFVSLTSFETDAQKSDKKGNNIHFSPDLTHAEFQWEIESHQHTSFKKALHEYRQEYRRRFQQYVKEGHPPFKISPPPLKDDSLRKKEYKTMYYPSGKSIAVGKPVQAGSPIDEAFAPSMAVNGKIYDRVNSFWAGGGLPQWLKIDLEDTHLVNSIHVFPYWDGARYYQYNVEVSEDGKLWKEVADMKNNTTPSSPLGFKHQFDPVEAQYIRINILYNSENHNAHLVEVKVFEKTDEK